MRRLSSAIGFSRIWWATPVLITMVMCMPSLAQAEEGMGLEQTYDPGYNDASGYGAPWYSKGQEELDRTYGRRDGGGYYDEGPTPAERRKETERRQAEETRRNREFNERRAQQEAAQAREHANAQEAMYQGMLPWLTNSVRVERERYEALQSQVRFNPDVTRVAFTVDTFAETYGVVGQIAEKVQASEAVLESQLDASAERAPPLGPEQVDALGIAVQGAPFETQASMQGFEALVLTSVQHQEVSFQVASLQHHAEQRRALLDSAALFIAGADQSFAGDDTSTGYSLLGVAQEGLDLALTLAAFTPAGATFNIARTVSEYVSGYDFITGTPIDFDAVDAVGLAMALIPSGKPFAKLAKIFGKIAKTETRLGTDARRLWGRLTGSKGKNSEPTVVANLEKAGEALDGQLFSATRQSGHGNIRWGSWEQYPKTTIDGRQYAMINGRPYTRHAIDYLTPKGLGPRAHGIGSNVECRGIPPVIVEDVLENGLTRVEISKTGVQRVIYELNNLRVVTENEIVLTVRYFSAKGKL